MTELSFKDRERQRREHEILLQARRLIRLGGFADLTMDDLAQAVGVSKPTLYQHFRSKDDLTARVIVDYVRELEEHLQSTSEATPLERLKAMLRAMLVQRYGSASLLTDYENESVFAMFRHHPEVVSAKKRLMSLVNQVVEQGKANGEIAASTPTSLVGCLLFRMLGMPATLQSLASETEPLAKPQARDQLVEAVVVLFERSVTEVQSSDTAKGC